MFIEVLHIALPKFAHQRAACFGTWRCHQQMDVVRHQAIGVNEAAMFLRQLTQMSHINEVVAFLPEAIRPVVSTLNEVNRDVGKD
jgi:hypothetical protein